MYKFGQIEIESKKFNSEYQIQKDVDCGKDSSKWRCCRKQVRY